MAEIVVGTVVNALSELLSGEFMNFARSQGIDSQLKKLEKTLPMIEAVLADAAQKRFTQRAVELWLSELQDLFYDIEDVLDEIATEAHANTISKKRKWNHHANYTTSRKRRKVIMNCIQAWFTKVMKIIIPANFTPDNMMYRREISCKLEEIIARMHDLFQQRKDLGLKLVSGDKSSQTNHQPLEDTSLVYEYSEILGREEDKQALLEKLLGVEASNCHNVKIVSIVGLGGVGKTTLARVLYHDEQVKAHFELRAWVSVSDDDFDVFKVSKAIYQAVVGGEDKTFTSLDLLQVALKQLLSNQRFLLVLDNVWNENHKKWDVLKRPLVGKAGSKVIVTTRNTTVASVMNSVEPHNLGVLSDETSLSLFAQYALDEQNFDKHPSLSTVARSIVDKCGGLPLALVTIGRVLKTKGNDVAEWAALLDSEIWSSEDASDILPALKLSYYHLPSHLKQPFAYCSMFPKGHRIDKNKLVLKWMAQGFLSQPKVNNQPMESLGQKYFQELLSRSFFQPVAHDESMYTMHDLINDLATSVAGKFFFRWDGNMDLNVSNKAYEKVRHFSFSGEYKELEKLRRARSLRTFFPVSSVWGDFGTLDTVIRDLLPHLQFLRVLSLTNWSIIEVPQSIVYLKLLRSLDLSENYIQRIPEGVSELYNLQIFKVCNCHMLRSMPVSFANLGSLRHLDMHNTPVLKKTPLGIGGSKSLRTLTKVYIEGGNGFKISELKGLSDLQGKLSIKGLENVIDLTEANDANLQHKKGLDNLELEWSDVLDDSRDPANEDEVLERLMPPSQLKKLGICFYGGMKFPSWLGNPTSFYQLTELTLRGCENCTDLPTLGHMTSLRKLCLSSLKAIKTVGVELLSSTKPFHGNAHPSLESLKVDDMQGLETWSTSGGDDVETPQSFPSLRTISITRCPKLGKVSFGLIPSLKDLTIAECPEAVLRGLVGVSSSIRALKLNAITGLTQLDREVLQHLGAVEDLSINDCDDLRHLWESESEACMFIGSLQNLSVSNCQKLVYVGSGIMESLRQVTLHYCNSLESYCCPNRVEKLVIKECASMTSLRFYKLQGDFPSSSSSSSSSSNLKILVVKFCENIKSISQEHLQSLTSLEVMKIYECPIMEDSFSWPPNLRKLVIGELKKPMSEWVLQNYPSSLVELTLFGSDSGVVSFGIMEEQQHHNNNTPTPSSGVVSFGIMEEQQHHNNNTPSSGCFLLPPSLTHLWIFNFEEVESLSEVLQHLPHLQELYIEDCPRLRDVPETTSSLRVYGMH